MYFNIGFGLPRHWSKHRKFFTSYYYKKISEHKTFEWQTEYWGWTRLFRFELDLSLKGECHAGPKLELTLFGFMVAVNVYDHRHWDHDTNDWEVHNEQDHD